jgi:acyl-CoA synthetase (NDP forming)
VGAIRVRSIAELVDAVALAARDRSGPALPARAGAPRLGIITNSGGTGILSADAAVAAGLRVPVVGSELRERLAPVLPAFATPQNPVDLTGHYISHPEMLDQVAAAFLESGDVDALLIYLGMIGHLYPLERIVTTFDRIATSAALPVVVVWQAGEPTAGARIASSGLPVFDDLDRAIAALSKLLSIRRIERLVAQTSGEASPSGAASRARALARDARRRSSRVLGPSAGREILFLYGISAPESVVCQSADDAAVAAGRLGFPVVMKIESDEIAHKTDLGGVRIDIRSVDDARRAYEQITNDIDRRAGVPATAVRVERQVAGIELVLGMISDPALGPYISIGPGGVLAELISDVAVRRLPLEPGGAERMLESTRIRTLLDGYRGASPADRRALVDVIERWAALARDIAGEVDEAEINPLIAGPDGAWAADVLITLRQQS